MKSAWSESDAGKACSQELADNPTPDFANASPAELNDWYKRVVGYAPQEDCPAMPDSELRELCKSYHDGMVNGFD